MVLSFRLKIVRPKPEPAGVARFLDSTSRLGTEADDGGEEVSAGNDADRLVVHIDNDYAMDVRVEHHPGQLADAHLRCDGYRVGRHANTNHLGRDCLQVDDLPRRIEPPAWTRLANRPVFALRSAEEVRGGEDADAAPCRIDNGGTADASVSQQASRPLQGHVLGDRDHVATHQVRSGQVEQIVGRGEHETPPRNAWVLSVVNGAKGGPKRGIHSDRSPTRLAAGARTCRGKKRGSLGTGSAPER